MKQQLTAKYQPVSIGDFAGIARPKAILTAFAAEPYQASFLFVGPSGTGKTTMGLALAAALGAEVHHIPSRRCDLETVQALIASCHYLPMFSKGSWHVPLIDEADQMSRPAQHAFLSALDATAFPPNTVFVFTANETSALEDRFLSRCLRIDFTTDSLLDPGTALLKRIWKAETKKGAAPEPDFGLLLRAAKFNVREAIMSLEMELLSPGSVSIHTPRKGANKSSVARIGKDNGAGLVYTIGCEEYTPAPMREAMKSLGVHTLIDCCWHPQRKLRSLLGDNYQWAGDRLSCANIKSEEQEESLKWLVGLVADGKTVMLMYPAAAPGKCKRHSVIAMALLDRGIDAIHVFEHQLIQASELQASIEEDREYEFKKWRTA